MQNTNQPNFQQYTKLLKNFYTKILKPHPNMLKLTRNFLQMIQDLNKTDYTSRLALTHKKSQVSLSIKSNTHSYANRSIKSLRSLTMTSIQNKNKNKNKNQYIYGNVEIKKVLLFGYLHHVISVANVDVFNMIQAKSKLLIQAAQVQMLETSAIAYSSTNTSNTNNTNTTTTTRTNPNINPTTPTPYPSTIPTMDKTKWDRNLTQWKRIMQLMNYKIKVRWQKVMSNSISSLQTQFTQILLRAIVQTSGNLNNLNLNLGIVFNNIVENLEVIAGLLRIGVRYQEIQDFGDGQDEGDEGDKEKQGGNQNNTSLKQKQKQQQQSKKCKKVKFGDTKHILKLAYIKSQKIYIYYDKLLTQKILETPSPQSTKLQDKNFLSVQARPGKSTLTTSKHQQISPSSSNKNQTESISLSYKSIDSKQQKQKQKQKQKDPSITQSSTSKKRPTLPTSLIKKKNLKILQALIKQYNNNTNKLLDLECLEIQDSKEVKIKRMLQSRKKIQES